MKKFGYMDEEKFTVLNDVDFCLKIREKGYKIVYNPYVELFHYESKAKGYEVSGKNKEIFEMEKNNFKEKWKNVISKGDPYYNKNLTLETVGYEIRTEKIE